MYKEQTRKTLRKPQNFQKNRVDHLPISELFSDFWIILNLTKPLSTRMVKIPPLLDQLRAHNCCHSDIREQGYVASVLIRDLRQLKLLIPGWLGGSPRLLHYFILSATSFSIESQCVA